MCSMHNNKYDLERRSNFKLVDLRGSQAAPKLARPFAASSTVSMNSERVSAKQRSVDRLLLGLSHGGLSSESGSRRVNHTGHK
jgi:hypothetical protein